MAQIGLDQHSSGWVLDRISGEEIHSPSHQPAEVLSALSRLVRDGTLGADDAIDALQEASALPQRLVVPTAAHLQRAFSLSGRIRVLDGLYVALAEELGCALVTTDSRLLRADPPCEVQVPGHPG